MARRARRHPARRRRRHFARTGERSFARSRVRLRSLESQPSAGGPCQAGGDCAARPGVGAPGGVRDSDVAKEDEQLARCSRRRAQAARRSRWRRRRALPEPAAKGEQGSGGLSEVGGCKRRAAGATRRRRQRWRRQQAAVKVPSGRPPARRPARLAFRGRALLRRWFSAASGFNVATSIARRAARACDSPPASRCAGGARHAAHGARGGSRCAPRRFAHASSHAWSGEDGGWRWLSGGSSGASSIAVEAAAWARCLQAGRTSGASMAPRRRGISTRTRSVAGCSCNAGCPR